MDRTTEHLRATADMISRAQAFPTDTVGITRRRLARATAEQAWLAAGCPDLPAGTPKPAPPVPRVEPAAIEAMGTHEVEIPAWLANEKEWR